MDDKAYLSDEELSIWLGFQALPTNKKLNFAFTKLLYDRFQDIRQAWHASAEDLRSIQINPDIANLFIEKRRAIEPEKLLEQVKASGVRALAYPDPCYPSSLRHTHEPPHVLFVKGRLLEHDFASSLAIVGTRRPTQYGQKQAKEFAKGLAANGAVIVSGLALGVDSLAHWGAIEGGGRTIAVVASGPDVCYPSSNKRLYNTILDGHGAVISEYLPGTPPEKWRFPARNRIISGVSEGVVVVEAGDESGALITAQIAFNQSREVYAIPGRVDSAMSIGTNRLIAKNYAQLVSSYQDVLDQKGWVKATNNQVTTIVELYGREKDLYEMLSNEPVHFDVICERSEMPAGELSATLTMLELAGLVVRHPGDWYSRQDQSGVSFQESSLPQGR